MPIPHTNFNQSNVRPPTAGSASTLGPSSHPAPLTASIAPIIGTDVISSITTSLTDDEQTPVRHYGEPRRHTLGRINAFGDPDLFQIHQDSLQQEDGPVLALDLATNHFSQPRPSRPNNPFVDPDYFGPSPFGDPNYFEPGQPLPQGPNPFGDPNHFEPGQPLPRRPNSLGDPNHFGPNPFGDPNYFEPGQPRPQRPNHFDDPNHFESGQPRPRRPSHIVANRRADNQRDWDMILIQPLDEVRQNNRGPRSSSSGLNSDLTPIAEVEVTGDEEMIALRSRIGYLQERLFIETLSGRSRPIQIELVRELEECVEELDQRERNAAATTLNQTPLTATQSWSTPTPPPNVLQVAIQGLDLDDQITYVEDLITGLLAMYHTPQQSDEAEEHQDIIDELTFRLEEFRLIRVRVHAARERQLHAQLNSLAPQTPHRPSP